MKNLLIIFLLILIISVAYFPGISNKPTAEDFDRPESYLKWTPKARWLPLLALLKFGLEKTFQLQPNNPEPYHIASILVHVIVSLMAFRLYKIAIKPELFAFIGALIFVTYPRHHESIFHFIDILHPLMTIWFLSSLLLYDLFMNNLQRLWLILSAMCFLFALLSSEAAIAGFGIICCYYLTKNRQVKYSVGYLTNMLKSTWPFMFIVLIYALALFAKGNIGPSSATTYYHARLSVNTLRDLIGYFSYSLFLFIPLREITSIYLKIVMAVVTFMVFLMLWIKGSRWVRFGILWMIFSFTIYSIGSPFGNADRYFYFPSIGLCLIISDTIQNIYKKLHQKLSIYKQYALLGLFALFIGIYVLWSTYILWTCAAEWRQAGEIADEILNQVYARHPIVKPGTTFYFWGLPARYGQAKVLFNGVEGALIAHYNQFNLHAYVIYDLEILKLIQNYGCSKRNLWLNWERKVYIYVFQDGRLMDCTDAYDMSIVRNSLENLSKILVP